MLWIGNSYPTVESYLREASLRGACRKVSGWPTWAKPGRTRVFLLHPGRHRNSPRAVLFGYYVLAGVDVVLPQADCDEYKELAAFCLQTPAGSRNRRKLRKFLKTPTGRRRVEPLLDFWRQRAPMGRLPARLPPAESPRRDPLEDLVIDLLLDFLISCEPDSDPQGHCGYGVSGSLTALEAGRDCGPTGLRDGPSYSPECPWFYLVDAIEREIVSEFCDFIKDWIKESLEEEERQAKKRIGSSRGGNQPQRESQVFQKLKAQAQVLEKGRFRGHAEFSKIAAAVSARKSLWARIPVMLSGIAEARGALVVFKQPYPFVERRGGPSFRGMARVDGDLMLREVRDAYRRSRKNAHDRRVKIHYCS